MFSMRTGLPILLACFFWTSAHAGYTHYFTWNQKPDEATLKECIKDMALVIQARKDLVAGPDEETNLPVILTATNVEFNGLGENAHEPFVFPGEVGFNFCKTEWKPYDEVVTACLIVARDHFPASVLAIDSDGEWYGGDWDKGAQLYQSVFHRRAKNPIAGAVVNSPAERIGIPLARILLGGLAVFLFWHFVWKKQFQRWR